MRPKVYFAAKVGLVAVLAVIAFALSAFVLSFIFFSLHESGEQFLLGFGWQGIATFFVLFPWGSFSAVLLLFIMIEWLLRSFKFGYRIPILVVFIGVFAFTAVSGFLVARTPFHAALLERADRNELPLLGDFYETIRTTHEDQGVIRGVITSITDNTITIAHDDRDRDADDGTHAIALPEGFNMANLSVGERIYVAYSGSSGNAANAYGIELFPR